MLKILRLLSIRQLLLAIALGCLPLLPHFASKAAAADLPELTLVKVKSSIDDTLQPVTYWAPESARQEATPVLVFLHSWSGNYRQNNKPWFDQAVKRGWVYLHPDFRGRNDQPEACGSALARQDILDAIDFISQELKIDSSRIYLAGSSGGGHMSMLMAGYHPERFSAVSAWVGISDLGAWRRFHTKNGQPQGYAKMVDASCGGAPDASPEVAAEYRARSPLFHLHQTGDLPLDLNAGVNDGHTGSVPISHTLNAFNVIAKAAGSEEISDEEADQLWKDRQLKAPRETDQGVDPRYDREIRLRRTAGAARVTIFQGGHEGLAGAGCAWLADQQRETKPSKPR